MIWLLLLAAWTILVVRLLGARATLGLRAFLSYLLLGILLAPVIEPLIYKLISPYGTSGPWTQEMLAATTQIALLATVAPFLLSSRLRAMTSVADAFLIGFMVGLGFDLAGAVTAATLAGSIDALQVWPPFTLSISPISVAGYAYWTGLLALTVAVSFRFLSGWLARALLPALVFVWVVTEQAALATTQDTSNPAEWLGDWVGRFQNGAWTAWIVLAALIVFEGVEALWVAHLRLEQGNRFGSLQNLWHILQAAARGRPGEAGRLAHLGALRRQTHIVETEALLSPTNALLQRDKLALEARLQRAEAAEPQSRTGLRTLPAAVRTWASWKWLSAHLEMLIQVAACVLLVLLYFPLPGVDANLSSAIWESWPFGWSVPFLPVTVLSAVLMVIILWRYVISAGKPQAPNDADDVTKFNAERAILTAAIGIALIVYAYVSIDRLYPFPNLISYYTKLPLPQYSPNQIIVLILLFALVLTGTSLGRTMRWQRQPIEERRASVIRNLLALTTGAIILWIGLGIYIPILTDLQSRYGADFFRRFGGGAVSNTAVAVLAILAVGAVSLLVSGVLRYLSRRVEVFLTAETPGATEKAP
jgi:hypothetical protein